ncbi:uncharacterized protein [Apostichopus japonicus]|uniref:uncharacterized protein isoform X5 n=1 Tax=Stichopus japonicus TaxID=307972 RepID=UPI003AB1E57C
MKSVKSEQGNYRAQPKTKKKSSIPRLQREKEKLPFIKQKSLDSTFLVDSQLPSISEDDESLVEGEGIIPGINNSHDGSDSDWLSGNLGKANLKLTGDSCNKANTNDLIGEDGCDGNGEKNLLDPICSARTKGRHQSGSSLGRLITEEDLLDTIFFSCDEHKTGRVPPSVLLEYVKMIMISSHLDGTPVIDELANMLDPASMDIAIDLHTYQSAMAKWIKNIQETKPQKLIDLSSSEDESYNVPPLLPQDQVLPSPIEYAIFGYGNSTTSSNDVTGRESREADLTNELEYFKFQVKKLSDQNSKLQNQMESTEENNSQLLNELDTVQKKLRSSELISHRSISIREQNKELQNAMSTMEISNMDTEQKYQVVVEERDVLQLRVKNLMEEIEQAYSDIDEKKSTIDEMQQLMNKLEREFQVTQEKLALQSVELAEKSMQFEDIQEQVKELLTSKAALQTEKNHLEEKVCEMKQELTAACQVLPDNLTYLETEADMEEEVECPAMMHPPLTCSTPYKQPRNPAASISLFSELKAVSSGNTLQPVYGLLPYEANYKTHVSANSPLPDATMEILNKLQEKKEAILGEVQEMLKGSKEKDSFPVNGLSKEIVTCINKEMDDILDQLKIVAKAKQLSDERAQKLAKLLAEVTDEKASLIRQFEEAKTKLQQLTYDQQQLELVKAENEILELSIEQEKSRLTLMEQRLADCQMELKESRRREVRWQQMALNAAANQDILTDRPKVGHICHARDQVHAASHLFDALALESVSHKRQRQPELAAGLGLDSSVTQREEPFTSRGAGNRVLSGSSPLTPNCERHFRRAKSEDSTFLTARELSSLSSVNSDTGEFRTADILSQSCSVLPECDISREVSLSWDHSGACLEPFTSARSSLDGNNNESRQSRASVGTEVERHQVYDQELANRDTAAVKGHREIAIQTIPSPPSVKSERIRRKSLPRVNLPIERGGAASQSEAIKLSSPPSPPSSPLLKIPRLSRPGSPHSLDSDTSLSSQLSFKTANSSTPPGSPLAKLLNCSREADISSEGVTSPDSSFSLLEPFHSCVEADLTIGSKSRMDKNVDENCNKNGQEKKSMSQSAFQPVAKTKRANFDRKRSYSASTFDEDGSLVDLISADLDDAPLTEVDKEMNATLLKESQAASERFWNRRGRKYGQAGLGIETTTSGQSEGSEVTSDKKDTSSTEQEKTAQEKLSEPEDNQGEEKVKAKTDDVRAEILMEVGPVQRPGTTTKSPEELERLRQENKITHRRQAFLPMMPELVEASEAESTCKSEDSAPEADKNHSLDADQVKNGKSEGRVPLLQRKRSSILSDALLKSLGLAKPSKDPQKMSDREVEMKFSDLSMALKSSKDTLDKRVEIQTRERNLAEENMGKELEGLVSSIQVLELHASESALCQHASQLQQKVGMLRTMTLNLSSKAEGLGQVLQEKRISTACEVMVKYVDNLRVMLDRKKEELEDAKKVIQDNRLFFRPTSAVADDLKDSSPRTRRTSVGPLMGKARRRASVAVFSNQSNQDPRGRFSSLATSMGRASFSAFPRPVERANTIQPGESKLSPTSANKDSAKHSVTFADTGSLPVPRAVSPLALGGNSSTPPSNVRKSSMKMAPERKDSIDGKDPSSDESFRQGFEQGVHNQVSQELEDLREQQRIMVENLEELMDSMEEDDKEEISKSTSTYPQFSHLLVHPSAIQWVKVQKLARLAATFFLVLAACCSIVFTLMPAGSLKAGVLAFESPWSTFRQFFWPYTSLLHSDSPPR